ncbi:MULTISPECIES: helix-turn-helix domain-containing protein [Streptomyces]|nr:helix-turn-helix transcriptional regulator [Streptomyces tsukubensis]
MSPVCRKDRVWAGVYASGLVMSGQDELPAGIPIGGRLALWRTRRGLTRSELADRAGIPAVHIEQWESGADWVDRHGPLAALAAALRLDPGLLTGQPYPAVGSKHASVRAVAFQLRRQLFQRQATDDGPEPDGDFAHRVRVAVTAEEAGDEYLLARGLPGLIRAADRTAANAPGSRTDDLWVRAQVLAAGLLRRLGYRDLAGIFLHRARSAGAEAGLVVAEEIRLLIDLGLPEPALARADRAGDVGSYAELTTLTAFAEAMAGRSLRAAQLLSEAARRAEDERSIATTTAARAVVALEYGAPEEAAEHARAVDLSALRPSERVHLLRAASAAAARLGDIGSAIAALAEADAATPLRFRLDPFARELVVALSTRTGGGDRHDALRVLTERIGLS